MSAALRPFLLHPRPDAVLAARDGEPVRAHDFLLERQKENGELG